MHVFGPGPLGAMGTSRSLNLAKLTVGALLTGSSVLSTHGLVSETHIIIIA